MDSFFTTTTLVIFSPFTPSKSEESSTDVGIEHERGGGSGNSYCVIAHVEAEDDSGLGYDYERRGGSGNSYCIIT